MTGRMTVLPAASLDRLVNSLPGFVAMRWE
jgi:hypothetical protein